MTFDELVEKTKDLDLASMGISLGKPAHRIDSLICYKDVEDLTDDEIADIKKYIEFIKSKRGS